VADRMQERVKMARSSGAATTHRARPAHGSASVSAGIATSAPGPT
jgi:hypothetical protein